MKKKILIAMILSFVLATGVVSAAANWGKFEGNNIVRLLINGKEANVKDVPAVMLNNRTMVPIYMLKDAGLDISWDGKTSTVSVVSEQDIRNNSSQSIEDLKDYFTLTQYYQLLLDLGDAINENQSKLTLAIVQIHQFSDRTLLNNAITHFDTTVKNYNNIYELINNNSSNFQKVGSSNEVAKEILSFYYDAIDDYRFAIENLESYYSTTNDKYLNLLSYNTNNALDNLTYGTDLADSEFIKYSKKITSYK